MTNCPTCGMKVESVFDHVDGCPGDPLVNESFHCSQCNQDLPLGKPPSLGYGSYPGGEKLKVCYNCIAKVDLHDMLVTGKAILYITAGPNNIPPAEIINYPGTLRFPVTRQKSSVHKIGRNRTWRVDAWFIGPDGAKWHGVNIGDNEMIRCSRLVKQKKKLQEIKPSTYLKPYNYAK